jgi:cold shock CspA family protein
MTTPVSTTPTSTNISTTERITVPEGTRIPARVKWFDNALNYGFATVLSGEHIGKDIFIHQSNILTLGTNVYRTLRMGEYIEFALEETPDSEHKFIAKSVSGPNACPLMCETTPFVRRPTATPVVQHGGRGQQGKPRGRGRGRSVATTSVVETPNA